MRTFLGHVTFFLVLVCIAACARKTPLSADQTAAQNHTFPDTLRVATLYSPGSYFIYRETEMGYDYEMVNNLARDKGIAFSLHVAPSLSAAVEMLDSGLVDLIAYEVPVTAEYRGHAVACGPEAVTTQVLVQPRTRDGRIDDVTQLVGREVWVEHGSKYEARLHNLNDELGGGIKIHAIDRDTLITEDLIAMVSDGEIPLTVVDSDIARINKTYYHDLDITLPISFPQRARWAVAPGREWLGDSIDAWLKGDKPRSAQAELLKRYYEMSKEPEHHVVVPFKNGKISPWDGLFKHYAGTIGYDWRLVASQGYAESQFDPNVVSWAGARGVMQIMPATARAYGLPIDNITDPEQSIATACRIIADLDNRLKQRVPDKQERRKFVVAAYNSGLAHILDAIALAQKYGMDATRWDGHVERALLLKSKPEYYNDEVVKYGYFRGRQTEEYVRRVMDFYNKSRQHVKA